MKLFHRHKLTPIEISVLGALGASVIFLSGISMSERPSRDAELKKLAAVKTSEAFIAIKQFRLSKNLSIDPLNDPQESGLIGIDKSIITTDIGDLESKLTSVNPNWSAVVIENLKKAGIKKGDVVAIGMTGSFPALNTAVIIGVETYGAVPVWIASEGSSNWGANIPGMTWLDMEKYLFDKGIIHSRAIAATLGGANNAGGGLTHEGRDTLRNAIYNSGIPIIETLPLSECINQQIGKFQKAAGNGKIRLYVNVGGGLGSLGTSRVAGVLQPGMNKPRTYLEIKDEPVKGNVAYFFSKGIPVLNFLNIPSFARIVDLPVAPGATPEPGLGPLFTHAEYVLWVNVLLLIVFTAIVLSVAFGFTDSILKNPRKEEV